VSEADHRTASPQAAPTDWSEVPDSHQKPLIALLIELVQRRLASQGAQEVIGDDCRRTQATG
jgi:hypothetical protein